MELDYRQAFAAGDFQASGTVSHDGLTPRQMAWLLVREWPTLNFHRRYILKYKIETVSDFSYLGDYEYVERDLLESQSTAQSNNPTSI